MNCGGEPMEKSVCYGTQSPVANEFSRAQIPIDYLLQIPTQGTFGNLLIRCTAVTNMLER